MKVQEESEKVGLKLSIHKTKIMTSGPITSWEIDGETVETVTDFSEGGGSKITAVGDCSHEMKRHLFLGRKVMTNLGSILKSRYYFANKGLSSQSCGFSNSHVWMWELDHKESWVPKNWCFWTVVLKKTLEIPLDCREIRPIHPKWNQSWAFIEGTDPGSETPILLVTWWEELTHLKRRWCLERLKARGEVDNRGWDRWMASVTRWTWVWASFGSWGWTGRPGVLQSIGLQRVRHNWVTELNWTEFPYLHFPYQLKGSFGIPKASL